jgi:hypothetical protein
MTKMAIPLTLLVLYVITSPPVSKAQSVPAPVRQEVLGYLKKQQACKGEYVQFEVESVKVGPRKSGFIGSCRYGGGISVLYEKTPRGIRKLLEVEVAMNGEFGPSDKVNGGYYDMGVLGRSGGEMYGTTYRWNGSRYVLHKSDSR